MAGRPSCCAYFGHPVVRRTGLLDSNAGAQVASPAARFVLGEGGAHGPAAQDVWACGAEVLEEGALGAARLLQGVGQ
jgi:hypothetical protein